MLVHCQKLDPGLLVLLTAVVLLMGVVVVIRVQHFVFANAVMADIGGVQRFVLVLLFVFVVFAIGRLVVPFERGHDQFDNLDDERERDMRMTNVSISENQPHSDSFAHEPYLRDPLHRNRCPSNQSSPAGTCSHLS